jgi:hypothetical protein
LLLPLVEHIISKYISFRRITYNINRVNRYRSISIEIINKYNKILAESNTNIYLEDIKPKSKSANRPGLVVFSIKIVLLSESVRDKTRIRLYIELIIS